MSSGQGAVAVTVTGKVTVGLALHSACITDSVVYPPKGSMA